MEQEQKITHIARTAANENSLTKTDKECLSRVLQQAEWRFFENTEYVTFVEGDEDCDTSLPDREKYFFIDLQENFL